MGKGRAYRSFGTRKTHQSQPIPGSSQVKNSAGGYAWQVNNWSQLDRFLILGSQGGTYYIGEQKLTADNATSAIKCIKEDGLRVVQTVVDVSVNGRAPSNDPALFVLAMCASLGNVSTRRAAIDAVPSVARIGTHWFHFLTYAQQFRGWGRLLRKSGKVWYNDKDVDRLAYQAIKYRQRDGWTHTDALRKAHPTPASTAHEHLYHWITKGVAKEAVPQLVVAFEQAQAATSAKQVAELILEHNLPREAVPTQYLNELVVWDALLRDMPMTAMIRNLGKMTSIGLLKPMGDNAKLVIDRLANPDHIKRARVHPIAVLTALMTYRNGRGTKGKLTWGPIGQIVDALDNAFYLAFGNVEPTGKNTMLALDISGSMGWSRTTIMGIDGLTPRVGSAAMALVTANVEPNYQFVGFSTDLIPLAISPRQRLDDVVRTISGLPMGGTDCAQPMIYALNNGINAEVFIIYTDNETWYGDIHPAQALNVYRQKTGINAKLIVVGMVGNSYSIADPNDAGMIDMVGFDTATPSAISAFAIQ